MKILLISYVFPWPPVDGERLPIYHFLRCLAPRARYTLLAVEPPDAAEFAEGRRLMESWGVEVQAVPRPAGGAPAQAVRCLARGRWLLNRFYWPELEERVARRLAVEKWDLVQVENVVSAQHLPRHLPCPALLVARDCLSLRHWRRFRLERSPLELLRFEKMRRLEKRLYPRFDRVLAIAPTDREAMRRLAPGTPVDLLPNGVDLEQFTPRPAAEDPDLVMFTGAMNYPPNVDAVVHFARESWPAVRAVRPGARFMIVGHEPVAAVRALGAADASILVAGPARRMEEYLARAALVVSPLRYGTGLKNKVLEGAAMARAMVVSPASLQDLTFEPGRDLIVMDSPADFAREIVRLLADPAARSRLGAAARRVVETHYAWSMTAERLWTIYGELIDKPPVKKNEP
jgi:glycosyltransferase involved in cell wall biosynthesis